MRRYMLELAANRLGLLGANITQHLPHYGPVDLRMSGPTRLPRRVLWWHSPLTVRCCVPLGCAVWRDLLRDHA